jgi:RimJ/RimL family protein N-acetyltransferase
MTAPSLFHGKLVRLVAPVLPDDAEYFARWNDDTEYLRQMDTDYFRPRNVDDYIEMTRGMRSSANMVMFHIRTLEDDRLIGFIAVHDIEWNNQAGKISVGIGDAEFRGKGYGSDAMRVAINYAFNELNLYRLGLDVNGNNPRAIRSYEKLGFKHEGAARQAIHRDGERHDRLFMGLLRLEWQG